jgi:hypothetical protein
MSRSNGLHKKSWLLIGICLGLAGGAQAGAMGGPGSISEQERTGSPQADPGGSMGTTGSGASESPGTQGTTGSSQGITGSPEGSSGTSRGTTGGTSGMQQGGSSSMGGSQGMGKIQPFQNVDKNQDNYVTKSELMDSPSLLEHFDRADANKDGQLEENEYKNLMMENQQ